MPVVLVFAIGLVLIPPVVDVDLWGHLRFGGDILQSHTLPSSDTYSFTADRSWVNHEWLAEVVMYGAYAALGPGGLTILRLALLVMMLAFVARALRSAGIPERRSILLVAFAAILTYTRTQHVRPQLFSLVLFAALVWVLAVQARRPRACWMAAPILAIWVNVHGGWIVGLGVLGLWTIVEALGPRLTWRRRAELAAACAAAAAATLANPYGIHLWTFLRETVGLGRPDISEWHSILDAPLGVMAFWIVTAVLAGAAIVRGRARRPADLAVVCALAVLSFRVSRLDAFFALAVFVLLAPQLAALSGRGSSLASSHPWQRRALALAAIAACAVRWHSFVEIDLSTAAWLPEPQAVEFMHGRALEGNMLTYFDWGEYAIWHLGPRLKVSIDGRRETVYSADPIEGHLAVYRNEPAGRDYIHRIQPDYIWLPKDLSVVASLRASGEWRAIYEGERSALLARHDVTDGGEMRRESRIARLFPGP